MNERQKVLPGIMIPRPKCILSHAVAGLVMIVASGASADIFSYTDSQGVVHFSTTKTPKAKLYMKSRDGKAAYGGTAVAPSDSNPERFTRYDEHIRQASALYQIPVELVRAVIKVESDYDPRAVSVAGARGLMQIMPGTAERMQVRDVYDPRENIFGGVRYLRILANMFNGDLQLTISGYNAGEGAVVRYGGIPPYEETRQYVARVLTYYQRYRTMRDVPGQNIGASADIAEGSSQ